MCEYYISVYPCQIASDKAAYMIPEFGIGRLASEFPFLGGDATMLAGVTQKQIERYVDDDLKHNLGMKHLVSRFVDLEIMIYE